MESTASHWCIPYSIETNLCPVEVVLILSWTQIWLWIDKPSLPTIKVFRLIIIPFHCYIIHVDGRDLKKTEFQIANENSMKSNLTLTCQKFRNERVSHAKVFPLDDITTLTLKCWHVTWHQWYKKSANWPPNYHKTAKTFPQIFWPLIQWISWL